MGLKVYLAGEIHTNWREDIAHGCKGLDVEFTAPVTDHDSSDDCGVAIMGPLLLRHNHQMNHDLLRAQ